MDNSSKRTCREERLLDKTDQRGEPNSRGNGPVGKEEYLGELPRTENRIIEGMDLSDKRLSGKRLSGNRANDQSGKRPVGQTTSRANDQSANDQSGKRLSGNRQSGNRLSGK
uniref:Uncharacterized protein n=1 Tax=Trichuris muris TaxID=70415 RepID=A0A5S6QJR4_TRIMR